jgi:GTP cyclohydrolase I
VAIDGVRVRAAVAELLEALGEDPARPGLVETPARTAEGLTELFSGLGVDAVEVLAEGSFAAGSTAGQLVALTDIPFRSVCAHHLLPFEGTADIAYLAGERLAGLGRLARAVDALASRPQLQEELTDQLATAVESALGPTGVLVTLRASHACLWARGTRTSGATAITSSARGDLADPVRRSDTAALLAGASDA